ncbi:MAG: hypothetical protein OXL34_03765 [Gemmatimonadota bacterium]|nr:hypothetical protein [Gemmatimonadota bacterium]
MLLASNGGVLRSGRRISRFNTVAVTGGCLLVLGAGTAPKVACLQESGSAGEVRQSAAPELAGAIATALNSTLERRGWSVTPAGDGSGFAFKVSGPKGSPMEFELPTLTDILDRVARGETGFAELGGTGIEEEGSPPDWVPVYPGVRSNASTSVKTADLVVGGGLYVADASIADVLMWYFNWADRIGTKGKGAAEKLYIPAPGSGGIGRFALAFDLWSVTVFATEDDRGDSLLVVLYTRFAEGGAISEGDAISSGGI